MNHTVERKTAFLLSLTGAQMTQGLSNEMPCVATDSIVELDSWIVKGVRSLETEDNMYKSVTQSISVDG